VTYRLVELIEEAGSPPGVCYSFVRVSLIRTCDVRCASLIRTRGLTPSCVRRACDVPHVHVCRDSSICMTRLCSSTPSRGGRYRAGLPHDLCFSLSPTVFSSCHARTHTQTAFRSLMNCFSIAFFLLHARTSAPGVANIVQVNSCKRALQSVAHL